MVDTVEQSAIYTRAEQERSRGSQSGRRAHVGGKVGYGCEMMFPKCCHIALACLAVTAILQAQSETARTFQMANGRFWNSVDEGSKIFYVTAIKDSYMRSAIDSGDIDAYVKTRWAQG